MDEPIEELYFNWLCARVLPPNSPDYHVLLQVLHKTEFVWVVMGDENRAKDGIELRIDFLRETNFYRDDEWLSYPCSVFEMLLAFAYRANFQTGIPTAEWFWRMIANLGLDGFQRVTEDDVPAIQEILNAFIWRTYRPNGHGGLFPVRLPQHDQRKVEIWYQFCNYVRDHHLI